MSLTTSSVTNAAFTMTIVPSVVSPLASTLTLGVPLTFGSVSYVNTVTGTITAANNAVTAHTFSTTNDLPNWFFILVDSPIQLTLTTSAATVATKLPVQRFYFAGSPTPTANYNTLIIDTTTASANYTITAGQVINYSLYYGNGSLS